MEILVDTQIQNGLKHIFASLMVLNYSRSLLKKQKEC